MSLQKQVGNVRWEEVESLLDQILDYDGDLDRQELIDRLCGDRPDLKAEVDELLGLVGSDPDLLDQPLAAAAPEIVSSLEEEVRRSTGDRAGRTIDRYRLLEVLGRGGMGVVYLAERADRQFEKRVALKLLPRGLESPEKERRFLTERQILAQLEHPGIARLLDGGVTDEGYPYLVMEYVEGVPIDRYCEEHDLSLSERLELVMEVCAVVQFAHQNLVVHRDLKPGNILVTAQGKVKLLDFGIGKVLEEPEEEQITVYQPMTVAYASPEQLLNRPVATSSDVYSLGVLSYRLLAGKTPVDSKGLSPSELEILLRETSFSLPSLAVLEDETRPSSERKSLSRRIEGDLDTIIMKALRFESQRRYGSARELLEDIERYLAGLPIEAHPSTIGYRANKFVQRHSLAVVASSLVMVLLVMGVIAIAWQGRIAARERDRARSESAKAERAAEFLAGLFDAADPFSDEAGQVTTREVLDRGERRIRNELADEPMILGELLVVMSRAYAGIGDFDKALELASAAVDSLESVRPIPTKQLHSALLAKSQAEFERSDHRLSLETVNRALDSFDPEGTPDLELRAKLLRQLATIQYRSGELAQSVGNYRRALAIFRLHGTDADIAASQHGLATALEDVGALDTALTLKRNTLEIMHGIYGPDHPYVSELTNDVAYNLHRSGDLEAAETLYREALSVSERTFGPDHSNVAEHLSNLGRLLMDKGQFHEAEPYVRRAAEILAQTRDEEYFQRIAAEINLASLLTGLGDSKEAEQLYRDALTKIERVAGAESLYMSRLQSLLARVLHRSGNLVEAEQLLRHALDRQPHGAPEYALAETLISLGAVLNDSRRATAAEPPLKRGIKLAIETLPEDHWKIGEAEIELGLAMVDLGELDEARRLLQAGSRKIRLAEVDDAWVLQRVADLSRRLDG